MKQAFIPNDLMLDSELKMLLITGPNMGGKSTYMRQTALIVLLAHTGSFVPATNAYIGPIDRIFTRIGASDDLAGGRSTFMVEMSETATILHHATEQSLVLMDEIGRGTSTFDGLALAWAAAQYLAQQLRAYTLFATHYFELTQLSAALPSVENVHLDATEHGESLIFLHRVQPGAASKSFGIQVAKLAGLPSTVLQAATEKLHQLETAPNADVEAPSMAAPVVAHSGVEMPHPILKKLASLQVDELSPREALSTLYELKDDLCGSTSGRVEV